MQLFDPKIFDSKIFDTGGATPTTNLKLKVDLGSGYVEKPVKFHNGTSWVAKQVKKYNANSWS